MARTPWKYFIKSTKIKMGSCIFSMAKWKLTVLIDQSELSSINHFYLQNNQRIYSKNYQAIEYIFRLHEILIINFLNQQLASHRPNLPLHYLISGAFEETSSKSYPISFTTPGLSFHQPRQVTV